MKVSIVTVVFNSECFLSSFFESIRRYNDIGEELSVVVVDNSPTDVIIKKYSKLYPEVIFIHNPANTGFGAGNNIGAKVTNSDYILFINNDVEFIMPIFSQLVNRLEKNKEIGCAGIYQQGGGSSFMGRYEVPGSMTNIVELNEKGLYDSKKHFLSGAFLFFERTAFETIGGLDENIFMYFEESDILNRLELINKKSVFYRDLEFLHKVGNRRILSEFADKQSCKSLCYYLKKYNINNTIHIKRIWFLHYIKLFVWNIVYGKIGELQKILRIIKFDIKTFKEEKL